MVARGSFLRVALSYIVPGNTKFEPDFLFSQTANCFYKTDILDMSNLLHVIRACNAVLHQMASRNLHRWKVFLARKFVDIP
eukprot:IDg14659t1